jgi:serine/threonine protein kinase
MPIELDRLKSSLPDRYAIDSELGRGGMATVYLATDLKHDRRVAVKVLRPERSESPLPSIIHISCRSTTPAKWTDSFST